jgi:predicted ATPase
VHSTRRGSGPVRALRVRVAVSGAHSTGKSTLIASFLAERPEYAHEPEAFEALADDVDLTHTEGPTREGLALLLRHTIETVVRYRAGESVVFERSPVDYLAYSASSVRSWSRDERSAFRSEHVPEVREVLGYLDLIVLLPAPKNGVEGRVGESPAFRRRVDQALRAALLDDEYDLFDGADSPRVLELHPDPGRQLASLLELTRMATA